MRVLRALLLSSVAAVAGCATVVRPSAAQGPAQYRYYGPHLIPESQGGGWCWIDGVHVHDYAPQEMSVYRVADSVYTYAGPTVVTYWDPHPDPWGGECELHGYHTHDYFPSYTDGFSWNPGVGGYVYAAPVPVPVVVGTVVVPGAVAPGPAREPGAATPGVATVPRKPRPTGKSTGYRPQVNPSVGTPAGAANVPRVAPTPSEPSVTAEPWTPQRVAPARLPPGQGALPRPDAEPNESPPPDVEAIPWTPPRRGHAVSDEGTYSTYEAPRGVPSRPAAPPEPEAVSPTEPAVPELGGRNGPVPAREPPHPTAVFESEGEGRGAARGGRSSPKPTVERPPPPQRVAPAPSVRAEPASSSSSRGR